jgi:hypothetical protein
MWSFCITMNIIIHVSVLPRSIWSTWLNTRDMGVLQLGRSCVISGLILTMSCVSDIEEEQIHFGNVITTFQSYTKYSVGCLAWSDILASDSVLNLAIRKSQTPQRLVYSPAR